MLSVPDAPRAVPVAYERVDLGGRAARLRAGDAMQGGGQGLVPCDRGPSRPASVINRPAYRITGLVQGSRYYIQYTVRIDLTTHTEGRYS